MTTQEIAATIRWLVDALGHRIPDHWTDEQVVQFMLSLPPPLHLGDENASGDCNEL